MNNKTLYFAYGSNMNPERLIKRIGYLPPLQKASLQDYAVVFNKPNAINPNEGFANIVPQAGAEVEGILYEVTDEDMGKLDQFEGVPNHYIRQSISVVSQQLIFDAVTYIAVIVKKGLKPSRGYLNHLLAGKDYLSETYYQQLAKTICL